MRPTFKFRSSYLNETYYDVHDETGCYVVSYRSRLSNYERGIYNGPPEEYARIYGPVVGWLTGRAARRIPPATVAAYNAWRIEQAREYCRRFDADPERYGVLADDPIREPSHLAQGAAYWQGDGWVFETAAKPSLAA